MNTEDKSDVSPMIFQIYRLDFVTWQESSFGLIYTMTTVEF